MGKMEATITGYIVFNLFRDAELVMLKSKASFVLIGVYEGRSSIFPERVLGV